MHFLYPYQYLHSCSKTLVHKITNVPVFMWRLEMINDFDGGKSITRAIVRGGPLPIALQMDLSASKTLHPAPYKKQAL